MAGKSRRWSWPILLAFGAVMVFAATAGAKKKAKGVRSVVIDEVTRVEGKIQKPEVWYLLPRSNLNFEGLELNKKLAPKIEQETKRDPF